MTRKGFLKGGVAATIAAMFAPGTITKVANAADKKRTPGEAIAKIQPKYHIEYKEVMPLCWECPYCGALTPQLNDSRCPVNPSEAFKKHVNACRVVNGGEEDQAAICEDPRFEDDTMEHFAKKWEASESFKKWSGVPVQKGDSAL